MGPLHLLVIEDDPDTRESLRDILLLDGHRVETAGTLEAARELAWRPEISAVILELDLLEREPVGPPSRMDQLSSGAPVILLTDQPTGRTAVSALRRGAYDCLGKPIHPDALRAILRRLAESCQVQRRLAESETRQQALLDAIPDTILRISEAGMVLDVHVPRDDPAGLWSSSLVGRDIRRANLPETFLHQLLRTIREALATATAQVLESSLPARGGMRSFELRIVRSGDKEVVTIVRDVTAPREAVARSLQAERLAAIGQMVAGLAHESRNAFQRCQAFLEMLAMEVEDRPEALALVERIQQTQSALHYLYEEVRGYAAPVNLELQPADLAQLWRVTWNHLEKSHSRKRVALVEREIAADRICRVDANAIERVFRNVFENAIDACPEHGQIEVRCLDGSLAGRPALVVRVTDDGPGFTPEARRKVFEPFFTTKSKGTGLGMAIARRLVEAHGGRISVGEPPSGAEIAITLLH